MRSRSLRVAVLAFVCLVTWSITKSLMAQVRSKEVTGSMSAALPVPLAGKTVASTPLGGQPANQAPPAAGAAVVPDEPPVAAFRLLGHQQTLIGDRLKVDVSADIVDRRDGVSYVWVLTAAPDRGGVAVGPPTVKVVYDQQVFDVAATGQGAPTFSDVVVLPSGSHFVEVGLYGFPKGHDLSFLDDLAAARSNILIGGSGTVVVP